MCDISSRNSALRHAPRPSLSGATYLSATRTQALRRSRAVLSRRPGSHAAREVLRMAPVQHRFEGSNDVRVKLSSPPTRADADVPRLLGSAARYGRCEVMASYASATARTREIMRDFFSGKPVGVSTAVPALVMVTDNHCDLGVVLDVREDPLADSGVLFHLKALLSRQCPGFSSRPAGARSFRCRGRGRRGRRAADPWRPAEFSGDVTRVHRDCLRVAGRVAVSRV